MKDGIARSRVTTELDVTFARVHQSLVDVHSLIFGLLLHLLGLPWGKSVDGGLVCVFVMVRVIN